MSNLRIWGRMSSLNVRKVVWCAQELALDFQRFLDLDTVKIALVDRQQGDRHFGDGHRCILWLLHELRHQTATIFRNEAAVFQASLPWLLGYGIILFVLFAGFVTLCSPANTVKQPEPD